MPHSAYLTALDGGSGKSLIAFGLTELLSRTVGSVSVFRPVVRADSPDPLVALLRHRFRLTADAADCVGVTYDDVHHDPDAAMSRIVERYHALAVTARAVIIVGTDYTDVGSPMEYEFNMRVAVNLGAPLVLIMTGDGRTPAELSQAARLARAQARAAHASVSAIIVNRADPDAVDAIRRDLPDADVIPRSPKLLAPTVGEYAAACDATILFGDPATAARQASGLLVAAMTLPNMLTHLTPGALVITPGDRSDLLLGLLAAHTAGSPAIAGIVLTGGLAVPTAVRDVIAGFASPLAVYAADGDTFDTATRLAAVRGKLSADSDATLATASTLFADNVDTDRLSRRFHVGRSPAVTPLMFEFDLMERARGHQRHIVLPEGTEPRILRAAEIVTRRRVARVTLLGDVTEVNAAADRLGIDIEDVSIVDPRDVELRSRFAREYSSLRAHRGITEAMAFDTVVDVSYFGTMMVHCGLVDGMVSGAAHTTAHTIRPAFEIIKAAPGVEVVSSVFFMCLPERVLVYGDCAVIPEPDVTQLADIAISAADSAATFGVEPKVAMLSYSTGDSGTGSDVERVREAAALASSRRPDLAIEGPIQYDAAVDAEVAAAKLPSSAVAGQATVFVVPDLNTGNNLYKAVQRSAGAVAIGPMLQGLRRPVNDLSRGATVPDIVNTIALTAVQAYESAKTVTEAQ
ncbi:phosphate acetyltransferase [Stackebrandtia soli]|uniref:phosphate acetyltransferase n=1 Tax=Stackebrandtia soli TaxID=1892856 RepID=UPI0039E9878A